MLVLSLLSEGFSPDSKLLSLSLRKDTGASQSFSIWNHPSQNQLLTTFFDYFLSENDKILTGFNILKFDLPLVFLAGKSLPSFPSFFRELNRANVVDLFPILTSLNHGQLKSLSSYCERFGVAKPPTRETLVKSYHSKDYKAVSAGLEKTTAAILALSELLRSKLNSADILGDT